MNVIILTLAALSCVFPSTVRGYSKVVDLTQLMNADAYKWPIYNLTFELRPYLSLDLGDGVVAYGNDLHFSEHTGTHMDAPTHFTVEGADQWHTHEIPPERLVGKLHVIKLHEKAAADIDYEVTVADIEEYEEKYGMIQENSIVLLDLDWAKHWSEPAKYFGSEEVTNPDTFHFPGLGIKGAELLAERKIAGFGSQTASIDLPQTEGYGVHVHLLGRNIWLLENVGDLSGLPDGGGDTILTVGVMNTENGTGGPVRLLALVNEDGVNSAISLNLSLASVCAAILIRIVG